jgi:hypothetical protein
MRINKNNKNIHTYTYQDKKKKKKKIGPEAGLTCTLSRL